MLKSFDCPSKSCSNLGKFKKEDFYNFLKVMHMNFLMIMMEVRF